MGWDDNGLATERRVQNYYGVRCDPSLPYDPEFVPPEKPEKRAIPISRQSFVELCDTLVVEDEQKFEELWRCLGLSVDWAMTYTTIGERSRRRVAARVPPQPRARRGVPGRGADALGRRRPHRGRPGRARGPRAGRRRTTRSRSTAWTASRDIVIETTRPELIPACVALVAHPDDERYQARFDRHGDHAAVRRHGSGAGPPARRSREGLRHRDDLHLRRHHRRRVVARAPAPDPQRHGSRRSAGRRARPSGERAGPDAARELRGARGQEREAGAGAHRRAAGRVG